MKRKYEGGSSWTSSTSPSSMSRKVVNVAQLITQRNNIGIERTVRNKLQSAPQFIHRLGLEAELNGHTGCVNCIEWSDNGQLLASGSDDNHIKIWDPFRHKLLTDVPTPHQGNIFSVKFMPQSNNGNVVSGAADSKIFVFDLTRTETPTWSCRCHSSRVKRLATAPETPFIFWSASEDGDVFEFDIREPHVCKDGKVSLVCLNNHFKYAQAKCIAVNPRRPELIAIGGNDCYARMYDRRMMILDSLSNRYIHDPSAMAAEGDLIGRNCPTYFCPGHLRKYPENSFKAITYLAFSPDGRELLVNMGAEQIYLYDINHSEEPCFLSLPPAHLATTSEPGSNNDFHRRHHHSSSHLRNGTTRSSSRYTDPGNGMEGSSKSGSSSASRLDLRLYYNGKRRRNYLVDDLDLEFAICDDHKASRGLITKITKQLHKTPNASELIFKRASHLMIRGYYGDNYAALRDFQKALWLDPNHVIGYYRLAQCLFKLHYYTEAFECLRELKSRFPTFVGHIDVNNFEMRISDQLKRTPKHHYLDFPPLTENESYWRSTARDYKDRFLGHCNTTTDIKEATFFGNDSNYIIAGSDDGNFYIWERSTNLISEVYRGDANIVNCVQPHPTTCLLATSGIETAVKLWSPKPVENFVARHRVEFSERTIKRNQYRMFESRRMS